MAIIQAHRPPTTPRRTRLDRRLPWQPAFGCMRASRQVPPAVLAERLRRIFGAGDCRMRSHPALAAP